jgi:uncharacterized lipoprotein YajG
LKKYIPLQRFNQQMIVLQILKSKEMKKIAFMFVAAALFVACGEKKAAEAEVPEVEEVAENVIDSAAVWALVGDTTGLDADSIAAKFQAVADSLAAAAEADTTAVEETAE